MTTQKPTKQEIHAYLRERILVLDLAPGARLREERLAAHFGVSRSPIRQVLDRLEFEGLVDQVPGAGARVSHLDPKELRDVWTLRLRLAAVVTDFIRLPASPEILDEVEAMRTDLRGIRSTRDLHALGGLYNRYHEAMLTMISNKALARTIDLLYVQSARVWMQFLPEMDLDREINAMDEELRDTLDALHGSSASQLGAVREDHLERLLQRFNNQMTSFPMIPPASPSRTTQGAT